MNNSIRPAVLAIIGGICSALTATAELVNASKIATGTAVPINWFTVAFGSNVDITGNLKFQETGRAKISSETPSYYSPSQWAEPWENSPEYPSVQRFLSTPAPYQQNGYTFSYDNSYMQRAAVQMPGAAKTTSSHTYRTGKANTVLNYNVRIEHTGAMASYFLTVRNPVRTASRAAAYNLCCSGDYNGGTYTYIKPVSADSRSAIDVLVNGLPVWSSEESYTYPDKTAQYAWDKLESLWGAPLDGEDHVIFLGKLSGGQSLDVSMVVRTDAEADAQTCGIETSGNYKTNHCFKLTDSLEIGSPTEPSVPGLKVWAKNLN